MESDAIEKILESVAAGKTTPAEALLSLKKEPFTDLGYAKVDHHRALRQNAAEVIYGEGKTPDQIRGIAESLQQGGAKTVLVTRMKPEAVSLMTNHFADEFTYFDIPRVGLLGHMPEPTGNGTIVVAAAGTSDMYAAEEAALTAEALGNQVQRLYDVGGCGASSPACAHGRHHASAGYYHRCWHGRCPCQCGGRYGFMPGYRGAHQRGLRGFIRRFVGPAFYAQFLCKRNERR